MTQLELPFAICGHRYDGRRCIVEPGHYGCHWDGELHWTIGVTWAPARRRRRQDVAVG